MREIVTFNLAIDSKLRGCDVVAIKVEDVAPQGYAADRATVRQWKTGRPVRFELTGQTRQAIDDYIRAADKKSGEYLFEVDDDFTGDACFAYRRFGTRGATALLLCNYFREYGRLGSKGDERFRSGV